MTICGSIGLICGSVITVGLRLGFGLGYVRVVRVRNTVRVRVILGLALGSRLLIVVYTNCWKK